MCGIVGYVGNQIAKPILLDGLSRLEYRGYDSAGFALYDNNASDFVVRRCVGAVQGLIDATLPDGKKESQGIAHTRWATHGAPTEVNAHPHRAGRTVLVHNGIIENHADIKACLQASGVKFESQTDTEVFARLIEFEREQVMKSHKGDFAELPEVTRRQVALEALRRATTQVHGHYAILFMVVGLEGTIFGVQNGAPLVLSKGNDGTYIASDLQPLLPYTRQVSFMPTGSFVVADRRGFEYFTLKDAKPLAAESERIEWSADQVAKDGYETFMLKEIFQQPMVVADTLTGRLPETAGRPFVWDDAQAHEQLWKNARKVYLIACGTAYHAALVAKYQFERWAKIPVEVDVASEFRYRDPVFEPGTLLGVISQSGETADTLAALRLANEQGLPTFSICNVPSSTIMRESKFHYPTKAGPEIGVASTKAFTAQLTVLSALAHDVARIRGSKEEFATALARLPHDISRILESSDAYQKMGAGLAGKKTILFVGRGSMFPIALEGALKLKEITYRHAEGYAAGELKHGPIALVDKDLAAIVLAPDDELLPKTLSNLEEIKSRGAHIIGVGQAGCEAFRRLCDDYIELPKVDWGTAPMLYVIPLQLISYGLAKSLGCNIDKPRNLAKSVTVE